MRLLLLLLMLLACCFMSRVCGFSSSLSNFAAASFRCTSSSTWRKASADPSDSERQPSPARLPNQVIGEASASPYVIPSRPADPKNAQLVGNIDWDNAGAALWAEISHVAGSVSLAAAPLFQPDDSATAQAIVQVCDELDAVKLRGDDGTSRWTRTLRQRALRFKRYELLAKLLRHDAASYVAAASFLSPTRIPRLQLPNLQDVPYDDKAAAAAATAAAAVTDENGKALVADCGLEDMEYRDSVFDTLLLGIFRRLVTKHTGGVTSDQPGIRGLLEQGRAFMLQPDQTPEAQHQMVSDTLSGLMTPVLPPFYRIFMAGIVPTLGTGRMGGRQLGPWFYAPLLTSIVTPTFFGFLVGPSRPNRRRDGQPGGLVVEKCKFLQESGCKGLCLHQCKLPAQQFFARELGVPLAVTPNFVTQECQWSFGETPVAVAEDPSFPSGCLVGCASRAAVNRMNGPAFVDLCN